jgi:hypothetical protein
MKRLLALLLFVIAPFHSWADDAGNAKLLALFPRFDADHSGALSSEEQAKAVESVRKIYGDQWARQIQKMFALAAAPDKSVTAENWRRQVADYGRPPVSQTVRIAMRDGKKLATDIYMPKGAGPFPVVLSRTPYSRLKARGGTEGFTANGMVYIVQDMRGRFDSEGENLPFIGGGWGAHQDGVDTLAWIRKQPWCNGNVGTIGGSAGGITQNLLAGAAPEGLKAQYISVAAASLYSDACRVGGAFRKADMEDWLKQNNFDPQALAIMRAHPSYDDYWRQFDTSLKFSVINAPAVHIGGWFDMFAQATIDEFVGRQHSGAAGARGAQKLIMGPWTHAAGRMPVGELQFPNSKPPAQYNAGRWFGHYLLGQNNGVEKEPAVAYYVMGDTATPHAPGNEWRQADDWPIPAAETAYYFGRGGKLGAAHAADSDGAHVEFTFDPANPCPTVGGNNLSLQRGPMNQNRIESRGDVILFTTAPLEAPVEVTGRVTAKIFISSSAVDTDLSVRLCDVYPDGKSYLIAEGIRRLRYRNSFEKPELLTPGKVEEVTVDCWSTSIIFNTGHRIRATITSSNYPRFDLNPGTGEQWSDSGARVTQTNDIFCDSAHASGLILPVVARTSSQ